MDGILNEKKTPATGAGEKMREKYNTIHIDFPVCFKCGKLFGEKELKKTKHHAIPQSMNPERNITIPMHMKCHNELNGLYTISRKRPKSSRPLKVFSNRMEGLVNSHKKFGKKIIKVYNDYMEEVKRIEEDGDTKPNPTN